MLLRQLHTTVSLQWAFDLGHSQSPASRLYFRITARSRSCGSAYDRMLSAPVIVSAASMAFTIAYSVACTVASKIGLITSLGSIVTVARPVSAAARGFAVEKAMKISPELFSPSPPMRPTPSEARLATRSSWWGSNGASVATTMMMEPIPSAVAASAAAPTAFLPVPRRS